MTKKEAFEWADDLLSGKYIQAKGLLKKQIDGDKFGYCCLGVECVRFENKGKGKFSSDPIRLHGDIFEYKGKIASSHLLPSIAQELEISSSPYILVDDKIIEEICKKFPNEKIRGIIAYDNKLYFIKLNDSTNIGFKGIAWLIKKYWNKIK